MSPLTLQGDALETSKGPCMHLSLFPIALTLGCSCFNPLQLPGPSPAFRTPPLRAPRPLPWSGNCLQAGSWGCQGLPVFAPHLSGITALNCWTSDVGKLLTAYLLSRLLIVSGRRVNLVPVIPSWPEVKVRQIFAECPILTKCQSLLNGRPSSVHLGCIGGQNPTPLASGKAVLVRKAKANFRNQCVFHSFRVRLLRQPWELPQNGEP